jgi:hypothetical protein
MRTPVAALLAFVLAPGIAVAVPKKAGPKTPAVGSKTPPACGAKILPLVTGNSWTYEPVPAKNPIATDLVKLAPRQPQKIVIVVKSVETKGTDTVASLDETITYEIVAKTDKKPAVMADVQVKSTIKCNKTKFEISPDSFFFAGEPGGYKELVFDKLDRSKDTSFKLNATGTIGDAQWREDIVAHFTRKPEATSGAKISAGKLELERTFTPAKPEDVNTKSGGSFSGTEKLALVTTGRVTLDTPISPSPLPSELPKNWLSVFWFQDGLGVVQTLNMYAHQYQLADHKLN